MAVARCPLRADELDCGQHLRTGFCVYGPQCKFNHPTDGVEDLRASVMPAVNSAYPVECKYYLLPGGCRYGDACRFAHCREKFDAGQLRDYFSNSDCENYGMGEMGLISFACFSAQMEEKECPFYARYGVCKYLAICRFRHPESAAVSSQGFFPGHQNAESPKYPESVTSPVSKSSGHSLQISDESDSFSDSSESYMPTACFLPQMPTSYDGYQGPIRFNCPSNFSAAAFASTISHAGLPSARSSPAYERSVQPPCGSPCTGDSSASTHDTVRQEARIERCCQRSNQRHHPETRGAAASAENLSPTGLPLRPGRPICVYYSQFGLCKYGPACQYDHPSDDSSTASAAA